MQIRSASVLQSLRSAVTMSESGEISEFAYIMELLARGTVSAMARGAVAWIPISGTTWPVSVGIPVIPGRGWDSRVYALSRGIPAAAECKIAFFIVLHLGNEPRGIFRRVWDQPGDCRGLPGPRGGISACEDGEEGRALAEGALLDAHRGAQAWRLRGGDCLSRHEARKEGPNSG